MTRTFTFIYINSQLEPINRIVIYVFSSLVLLYTANYEIDDQIVSSPIMQTQLSSIFPINVKSFWNKVRSISRRISFYIDFFFLREILQRITHSQTKWQRIIFSFSKVI